MGWGMAILPFALCDAKGPCFGFVCEAMFDRVVPAVFGAGVEIVLISNVVFPETSLPNALFTFVDP